MAKIISENNVLDELEQIGVDNYAINYLHEKSLFRILKLNDISSPTANIIKQEMLSVGGEVAVNKGCINCSAEKSDILVMGTLKQIKELIEKLGFQGQECKKIAGEIKKQMNP